MKRNKFTIAAITMGLSLFVFSVFILTLVTSETTASGSPIEQSPLSFRNVSVSMKTLEERTTLGAIGDILIHDRLYEDAKQNNGYDFEPMFRHVTSLLSTPDLVLANQESILGGKELGISSYPSFNSPQEVGNALIDAGIDIVSTANNHSLDKGEKGIINSLNFLEKIGLPSVGTYKNFQDQQSITILNSNGIKIAFLSYTYGTNGIPIPKGKDYLVNLIDKKTMKADIKKAREKADVVVMSIHWGNEYERFPTSQQKELAQFLANEGVDIIFGHHPHVLQQMGWLKSEDGRKSFVVYSLGNFLSGQKGDYKDIGGMATIEIIKKIDDKGVQIKLANPNFYPTYVSSHNLQDYQVVPLQEAKSFGFTDISTKYKEIMRHMTSGLQKNG